MEDEQIWNHHFWKPPYIIIYHHMGGFLKLDPPQIIQNQPILVLKPMVFGVSPILRNLHMFPAFWPHGH